MVEIYRRGFMFVLSSPSGAGKTTISRRLLELDENLTMSISATTREKRAGEVDGKDYFFIDTDQFADMLQRGEFLECAEVFGNHYGTPEKMVNDALNEGVDVLFDIDWQGTEQLAGKRREDLVSIFILPPSMRELANRLTKRASDTEEVISSRMDKAANEISHWNSYDYVLLNQDLDVCIQNVLSILHAERKRRERQHGLTQFVETLLES